MPNRPTVFMSYRRDPSADLARYIYERLDAMGADVFFDVEDINGGHFDATIEREIIARQHLLVILAPQTLESEWVRREIETALKHGKNIIPLETGGFKFDQHVPPELSELKRSGGIPYDFKSPETTFKRLAKALQITAPSSLVFETKSEKLPRTGMSTEVKIALIGLVGVIAAALIAIVPNFLPPVPTTTLTTQSAIMPTASNTPLPPTSTDTPVPSTNTPQPQPTTTVTINYQLDETATQIMLQRTAASKAATNEALFAESTYIALTANVVPTVTHTSLPPTPPSTSGLVIGRQAVIAPNPDGYLNLRSAIGRANAVLAQVPVGSAVLVLDGPTYAENLLWWKVRAADGVVGWTVEAGGNQQLLQPFVAPTTAPTQIPIQTSPVPASATPDSGQLHVFAARESLTLFVPKATSLSGFQFGVIINGSLKLLTLTDTFDSLKLTGGQANPNDCYIYQADGTTPPLSQSCKGQVFRYNIPIADVFWYDSVTQQPRDLAIFSANQSTGIICSATNPDCAVNWVPSPSPVVTNTQPPPSPTSIPPTFTITTLIMTVTITPPLIIKNRQYPCDATVKKSGATVLKVVRQFPISPDRMSINAGQNIIIIAANTKNPSDPLYQITDKSSGKELGYIPVEYVVLSNNCPNLQ